MLKKPTNAYLRTNPIIVLPRENLSHSKKEIDKFIKMIG